MITDNIGFMGKSNEGEYILCKECSKKSVSMVKLPEVMVVPVSLQSLESIKITNEYIHPTNYARKGGRYLAFYVCDPVSAITHYAKVEYILKNIGMESLSFYHFDFIDENLKYKIYKLENIIELKIPIRRGNYSPIQNARTTTLIKLTKAKYLNEL